MERAARGGRGGSSRGKARKKERDGVVVEEERGRGIRGRGKEEREESKEK